MNQGRPSDILDVSLPPTSRSTFLQRLLSLLGAVGLAVLFPLVILVLGIPLVLGVRALAAAAEWMLAIIR